jgi:hypothetical protein
MYLDAQDFDVFVAPVDLLLHECDLGFQPRVFIPENIELHLDCSGLMLKVFFLGR